MVCPKALIAIQGISRNVFEHAVSEIEMVEIILDHEREHSKLADESDALNEESDASHGESTVRRESSIAKARGEHSSGSLRTMEVRQAWADKSQLRGLSSLRE